MTQPARWAATAAPETSGGLSYSSPNPCGPAGADRPDGPGTWSPTQPSVRPAPPAAPGVAAPVDTSAFAAWTLECGPRSPGQARAYARAALRGWGLEELTDDIAVSVSEMVTNALCHSAEPWDPPNAQPVMLSLLRQGGTVLCAVIDPGTTAPAVRDADDLAEGGRGLQIVDHLADDWGWTTPGASGKAVWARFSAPADRDTVEPADHTAAVIAPDGIECVADLQDEAEWDGLTRLLLLSEILCGGRPTWLDAMGLRPSDGRPRF
ncbi:ATP-binding protein [Streptomyces chumphonensis]|uniref:ATP-binding protein n=1 Tax=Streptomyces chumphonensis TaxID=1214925 RepID=UPI003D730514